MTAGSWRLVVAVSIVLGLSTIAPATQVADTQARPQCLVRLLVPSYPIVARNSNSSATLRVGFKLGIDGIIQSQQIEALSDSKNRRLFEAAIERALKASEFAKTCGGQTVQFTFRFKMGAADAVWFEYPDTYEITALAPLINTSGRKKQP